MAGQRKLKGRYDTANVQALPQGLADLPRRSSIDTVIGAVDDPMEQHRSFDDPKRKRILVNVNRRVDLLELERSHKRISEAAYRTGRMIQAVLERASGARTGGGEEGCIRADPITARELKMIYAIEDASTVIAWMDAIEREIGLIDAMIVRQVIGDNRSFEDVAILRGIPGDRSAWYFARRFREALEYLSETWGKRGTGILRMVDTA